MSHGFDGESTLCTCVLQAWREFRSGSGLVAPQVTAEIFPVRMISWCRPMSHGSRVALPACFGWALAWPGVCTCHLPTPLCHVSIALNALLIEQERSGPSTRLMIKNFRWSCLWLGKHMSHEWSATCVLVQDVLSQETLSSSATCGTSRWSKGSPACYRQLVMIPK